MTTEPGAIRDGDPPASRVGIKAKLLLAFCSLAALTALASAVSWYVFADIGRSVTRVTAESLPSMVSALSLAQKSSEIAVTAPALMASRNQEERVLERTRLTERTEALTALIVDEAFELVQSTESITELKQREQELAEKSDALEQLSNQLAKYLSPQIYESIFSGRREVKVASQRKKLTVFFSDIAGFTETADRLESEKLSQLLNHYLTERSRIAIDHGATIDKYVGDSIVIFFGDPGSHGVKEDALACVKMAIAMRERMLDLEILWRDSGIEKPLKIRIGINTGYCTVGNFGSEDRMDYTIIGGAVNLAFRLESAATPGEILVSYETFALVKDEIDGIEREPITMKGIAYPVSTYQITDIRENSVVGQRRIREDHSNLMLNFDPDAMPEEERAQAAEILRSALSRISPPKP